MKNLFPVVLFSVVMAIAAYFALEYFQERFGRRLHEPEDSEKAAVAARTEALKMAAEEQRERAAREAAERVEREAEAAAEREARRLAAEKREAETDSGVFSSRVVALSENVRGTVGSDATSVLAAQLADPELNRLARKYLKRDFALARNSFLDRVEEVKRAEKAYAEALERNDEAFERDKARAADSRKAVVERRRNDERALEERIATLERERSSLDRQLVSSVERKNIERRKKAVRDELDTLRKRRNDALETGRAGQRDISADGSERSELREQAAAYERRRERIRKEMKPAITVFAVLEETSAATLKALENAIADRMNGR